jgi:hypothetical protein
MLELTEAGNLVPNDWKRGGTYGRIGTRPIKTYGLTGLAGGDCQ